MEIFPVQFCRNITMMSGRRYQRLEDGEVVGDRRSRRVVKLGGGGGRNKKKLGNGGAAGGRGGLRMRRILRFCSPMRLLVRAKDSYISAMLAMAGKGGRMSGFAGSGALWSKRVPKGRPAAPPPIDFDTRILIEVYKSLLAPREFAAL
ncbi:unnamed protein product [Spirodela intermedia]|uniref:Uncharacterized protein n=1 Tax=Spirodela intermedia TaxID=51605 RepID=A0A7I8KJI9_SPIIN|nr:unnamed protein product [Spirodela intermedia]